MHIAIEKGNIGPASIAVPTSKSLSHRALIAAALHNGISHLYGVVDNEDTAATIQCLEHLGATFKKQDQHYIVQGISDFNAYDGKTLDCRESGSTLRFLLPVCSLTDTEVTFTGKGRLLERPLTVYEDIFQKQGIRFEKKNDTLFLKGKLCPNTFVIPGNISSQFISGLLFALPLLESDSKIIIQPPYESKSYVDLTMDVLNKCGIAINQNENEITIKGQQTYGNLDMTIDGDDSQAAFFAVLGAIQNTPMHLHGISKDSRQGDHVIFDIIQTMGGQVEEVEDGYIVSGGTLHGTTIDLANCPDLGPILFVLATQAEGMTEFENTARLRIKESDRVACMKEELDKLGCRMEVEDNRVIIHGKTILQGKAELEGHNDHRIVMALSILATMSTDVIGIQGAEAIAKSYPTFFEDLKKTGVNMYD